MIGLTLMSLEIAAAHMSDPLSSVLAERERHLDSLCGGPEPRPRPKRAPAPDPIRATPAATLRRRARQGDPVAAAELARRGGGR